MADHDMATKYGIYGHNAFSNYIKDRLLNHLFGKEVYEPPDIYVGLLTDDPGDELTNENSNELLWGLGNYTRAYTPLAFWTNHIAELWNSIRIEFNEATVDWGWVNHFGLFDTWSPFEQGNALLHGPMSPKNIVTGSDTFFRITKPAIGLGEYEALGIGFEIL